MGRKIKFRAWHKQLRCMVQILSINFNLDGDFNSIDFTSKQGGGRVTWRNVDLMQFTGLHDKNGKEICEGDIVRFGYQRRTNIAVVEWVDELAWGINYKDRFETLSDNRKCAFLSDYKKVVEVIGNIYENPELLQEASNG